MITLEIETEDARWAAVAGYDRLFRSAADATLAVLPGPPPPDVVATLLLTDDASVRELNRAWRGQDKATNVLSFRSPAIAAPPGMPRPLGDVALAYETLLREAEAEAKSLADHAAHLVVHGLMHLLGHDHLSSEEADAMERLEIAALARLGIADPYAVAA